MHSFELLGCVLENASQVFHVPYLSLRFRLVRCPIRSQSLPPYRNIAVLPVSQIFTEHERRCRLAGTKWSHWEWWDKIPEECRLNVKQTHTNVSTGNFGVCSKLNLYNLIFKVKTNSNIYSSPRKENLQFWHTLKSHLKIGHLID